MKALYRKAAWQHMFVVLATMVIVLSCASEAEKKQRYMDQAQKYVAQEKYRDALIELKNAVQLDPEDDEIQVRLGDVYMKMGEVETAATHYGDAIDINKENLTAHLKIGRIYLAAKRPMEARMAAKWIIEKAPDNIDAFLLLAGVQVMEDRAPAAIGTMQEALAANPDALKATLFLAHLLKRDGRVVEAERTYLEAFAKHPDNPLLFIETARFYAEQGLWDKTADVLNKTGATTPQIYGKMRALAKLCEFHKKPDLAEQLYRKGIASAPAGDTEPFMDLGTHYAVQRKYEPALAAMKKALEINPKSPEILSAIARVHMDAGNLKDAEKAVDEALAADPNHPMANFLKGELFYAKREYNNALHQFELTIVHDADNFKAYYYKAMCLKLRGKVEKPDSDLFQAAAGFQDDDEGWVEKQVVENLQKTLELNPKFLFARHLLAEVYLKRKDIKNARKQIEKALSQAPRQEKSWALLGTLKILEGDLKGAEKLCKGILESNPKLDSWHMRLGVVYRLMGRHEDALAAFHKTLELNPSRFSALSTIVNMYLEKGAFDAALKACREQVKITADDRFLQASIRNMEGAILLKSKKASEAKGIFQQVIASHPDFVAPRMSLAGIHRAAGDMDAAIAQYEAVLASNASYFPAFMALGGIYSQLDDNKKAETYYRKALASKPGDPRAINNLAFILSSDDRKVREALDLAMAAKLKLPNDAEVRDTLGWLYYRTGQYNKAVDELESALKRNPDGALPNYHLGLAYYRQGRFENARVHLKKALSVNSDFPGAEDARKILDE